jgi:hypothetical protein
MKMSLGWFWVGVWSGVCAVLAIAFVVVTLVAY